MTFSRFLSSAIASALLACTLSTAHAQTDAATNAAANTATNAGAASQDGGFAEPALIRSTRLKTYIPAPASSEALSAVLPNAPTQRLTQEVVDESIRLPTIDLTVPPNDLWQRIRNGFGMPNLEDPLVTNRQVWYLNRPDYLRNTLNRSRRYLYHIVEELEKRGMPTELALLPLVESSYNPQAQSPARALGMWQFIPSTGRNYKLEQNWWLDERRDILASTSAALEYLQNIYEMNGDWHVALASYNWGEGAVARAMAKNAARGLPTDYLSLKMPEETRYYVPKLQAIKNIIADPDLFNFHLDPIPNKPYFATVEVDRNMDVALAARLADIPLTEFIALNPAYSRPVIPGSSDNPLVLPANKVSTFLANLEEHNATAKPLSNWFTYQLKAKEKLDAVAARYGISGARLRQLNGITKRTKVGPGMTLLLPGQGVLHPEAITAAMPHTLDIPPKPARTQAGHGKNAKQVRKAGGTSSKTGHIATRVAPTRKVAVSKSSAKSAAAAANAGKKPAAKKLAAKKD